MQIKYIIPALFLLIASWSIQAKATEGNVLARGTVYNVLTYDATNPVTKKNHPSYYGHNYTMPVDINIGSGDQDENTILYAPEDGTVTQTHCNTDCWGNAIEWSNSSGTEKIFLAHLNEVIKTGKVYGGEKIGRLGRTGGPNCTWPSHLHIESSTGWLELSGEEIQPPINPPGNGDRYVSNGPIKKLIYIWEPGRRLLDEEEYGIGWWPPDVPCIKAEEWVENKQCKAGIDKSICEKAFNILANRYWRWDGTYDGWHKIFFEEFNSSYLQCTAR